MSSRSLPAGQPVQPPQGTPQVPVVGGGYLPAGDMTVGPPMGSPAHGNAHAHGHGGRRRPHGPPHTPFIPPYYQHAQPMYGGYMPYASQYYNIPPQYPNGAMHHPQYVPYQNYARVPSGTYQHRYPSSHPKSIEHHSPGPAMPMYQPPPPPAPVPSQTPSSTHSSMRPPPTPPTPQTAEPYNETSAQQEPSSGRSTPMSSVVSKPQFHPPVPWLSHPNEVFPSRSSKQKTRRKPLPAESEAVSLPVEQHEAATEQNEISNQAVAAAAKEEEEAAAAPLPVKQHESSVKQDESSNQSAAVPVKEEQVATAKPGPKTQATPESSSHQQQDTNAIPSKSGSSRSTAKPAVPAVAAVPQTIAKQQTSEKKEKAEEKTIPSASKPSDEKVTTATESKADVKSVAPQPGAEKATTATESQTDVESAAPQPGAETATTATESKVDVESAAPQPAPKPAPTSWANLFAKTPAATKPPANVDGATASTSEEGADSTASFPKSSANSLAEAIRAYTVNLSARTLIEPRGLVNTGNMCYMNSVLQVLMFCAPFYGFLDQVSKKVAHSFKSETPLIDSMILLMQEFKVLKSAKSVDQLQDVLKPEDLEKFGEPFTPEFVYEAIRQLARFSSMERGHQQDAEEFLGFFLQSLDDECTHVMGNKEKTAQQATADDSANKGEDKQSDSWQEVGPKQRAAVTRSSVSNNSTPITKMFGGLIRSELRVPGLKDSIMTEAYQPLQLDIGSSDVRSVTDALRGITRSEHIAGDFNPARGKGIPGTKQVFIDSLPPILILHLKRFQYEGQITVKIWKKIDYPLELEIPVEALSRQFRTRLGKGQMPKYKLISVVYHHGKTASGGHYTVDVRRQDDRDWLRLDDTLLRQVDSREVASVGAEEEQKQPRKESAPVGASGNRYGSMNDEEAGDDEGWSQVPTSAGGNKRSSNAASGPSNGAPKGKQAKESVKDNKVAYLLFYQRI